MTIDTLPILTQDVVDESNDPYSLANRAKEAGVQLSAPVIALLDSGGTFRGSGARFRVAVLEGEGSYSLRVRSYDGSAVAAEGDYTTVDGVTTFSGDGEIVVSTGGEESDVDEEFGLRIETLDNVFIVRDNARGRILSQRGVISYRVYEGPPGPRGSVPVYEEDVYLVITN